MFIVSYFFDKIVGQLCKTKPLNLTFYVLPPINVQNIVVMGVRSSGRALKGESGLFIPLKTAISFRNASLPQLSSSDEKLKSKSPET